MGWPWVGEFVGFTIIFMCFPTLQNLVHRKHPNGNGDGNSKDSGNYNGNNGNGVGNGSNGNGSSNGKSGDSNSNGCLLYTSDAADE